jgi:hypothetical protein
VLRRAFEIEREEISGGCRKLHSEVHNIADTARKILG